VQKIAPTPATPVMPMSQARPAATLMRPAPAVPPLRAAVDDGGAIPLEPLSPPAPLATPVRRPPPPSIGIT
jgi:hypothetical protein